MKLSLLIWPLGLFVIVTLFTCDSNDNKTAASSESEPDNEKVITTEVTSNPGEDAVPKKLQASDVLYTWVDQLNLREAPDRKSKVVATIQSEEPLAYTGERSDQHETIVLRGVAYEEPWLQVTTANQVEGWVFGGAVKRKEETKGNALINDQQFDFPHFGRFDLKTWEKVKTNNESGGDAEIDITTYQKGNQILEITKSDVGEYGYSRSYKLMDANKKMLNLRELKFDVDPQFAITETVTDYTKQPAKQYMRSQKINKHFMQLNAIPEMANGPWKVSDLR